METLAYPHMTLAHRPQSDLAIAPGDVTAALSTFLPNWLRALGTQPKLSSAGWVAFLALGVATSSWVIGAAAIAQTNVPGNSGVEFVERAMKGAEGNQSPSSLKPLPNFQISNERPKSLADMANGVTMGFLGGDGAFRDDVRRPVANNGAPNAGARAVEYGTATQALPGSGGYLRYGMRSPQVTQLQSQLRLLGYFQGQSDGYFGNTTFAAVRAFQRDRSLAIDGVVGGNTRSALYSGAGSGGAPFTAPPRSVPQGVPRPVVNQQRVISRPRPVSRPAPVYTSGSPCRNYYTRIGHRKVSGSGSAGGCRIPCVGSKNQNVVALQNRLKTLGYFTFRSTGYYGPITHHAVIRFQRANGLRTDGIAGPRTKQALGLSF
ncbi:MAG: peptidoglycan-binding protein [Cyanophyceae cyanobacterium]